MTGTALIHVQHLLGIGHLQRALRIAGALAGEGVAAVVVSGGPPVAGIAVPRGIRFVQLPPVRAQDARFDLVGEDGSALDDRLRAARTAAVLAAFGETRPGAVVIEGYPFARRAFRFELDPLIAAARRVGSRVLCSVRDIVVMRDDAARHRDIAARVRQDFDAVLVHGDPRLIPFDASFPAAAAIADRLVYTGYVMPPAGPVAAGVPAGEVLVSAGGGAAGGRLMALAMAARRLGCLAAAPWRLLAGAALPAAEFAALRRAAPDGVAVERFRADFPALLRGCRVSVSQAGYNTVLDLVAARAPAVLVPFAAGRETEQLTRARFLAARGAAELVCEDQASPALLAAAIERAAARLPAALALDTGGARRSAQAIAAMLGGRGLVSGGGGDMIRG